MLRNLWNRIMGRSQEEVIERETERERGNSAERRFASESIEDYQADESVQEHLGGIDPDRLIEDEPPRT
jgi:hypothetical protein